MVDAVWQERKCACPAAGQKLVNKITGENKPINYNRDAMFFTKASGTARGTVAQNIADATGVIDFDEEEHPVLARILNGKSLADVYQLGMSMQDSAAIAGLAVINPVLGKVGTVLLATSSGTDAMLNAVSKGASDEQALTMGILTAGFEMIFEKYELESLLGQGKNFWQAFCKQGLSEAVGEGATEVANILADVAVMAEKSDWRQNINRYLAENPGWDYSKAEKQAFIDALLQVGEASFGGWISGSTMGGGYSTFQNIVDSIQKNQQAYNLYGQVQQELVTEALELNPNNAYAQKLQGKLDSGKQLSGAQLRKLVAQNEAVIQKQDTQNETTSQIDKVNQNTTDRNVGQQNATVQATNSQANVAVNQADVAESLRSKGVASRKVDALAEAIAARLNGQELTRTQSELLSFELGSPTVLSVVSEFINRQKTSTQQLSQNIRENMRPIQEISGSEKLQQYQIPKRRFDEFSEATNLSELHKQREKSGGAWVHGKEAENVIKESNAASAMEFFGAESKEDLKSIIQRSTIKLKNGFSCFPEGDVLNTNIKEVAELDGFFDVGMHGTSTAVGFGSEKANMSARTLAAIIYHSKGYNGQKIRLLSCSTGRIIGDEYCFAEELANALGVEVIAPDDILYISSKGNLQVGDAGNGKFVTFKPNQRRRIK